MAYKLTKLTTWQNSAPVSYSLVKQIFIQISGHFNFTFMLGEKGFNEIDMALLKHLLYNEKPLAFVRTQCDNAIRGNQDKFERQVW